MIPGMKHLSVKSGMKSIEFSLLFMLIRLYENSVHPKIQSLPGRFNASLGVVILNLTGSPYMSQICTQNATENRNTFLVKNI